MIESSNKKIKLLQFPDLSGYCNISHFITTRHGGVSQGNYGSMNPGLYTSDKPDAIKKNREILADKIQLPVNNIITPHQTHQDKILVIDNHFMNLNGEQQTQETNGIDALITSIPKVCISISTADCVPILIYSEDKQVVAAIHAGWRGTVQQIAQKTIKRMMEEFHCNPLFMHAAIGPSISQRAFEVGEEVVKTFRDSGIWSAQETETLFWKNLKTGKNHIDLWKANELQLLHEGIPDGQIENLHICTFQNSDDFFSARKLGIDSGRILSGIFIH